MFRNMKYSYKTTNTCAKTIEFEINDNIISNVKFLGGGCPGNLKALPKLVEGLSVAEISSKLKGINCGIRGTSCADQLAKAVKEAYAKSKQNA